MKSFWRQLNIYAMFLFIWCHKFKNKYLTYGSEMGLSKLHNCCILNQNLCRLPLPQFNGTQCMKQAIHLFLLSSNFFIKFEFLPPPLSLKIFICTYIKRYLYSNRYIYNIQRKNVQLDISHTLCGTIIAASFIINVAIYLQ